MTDSEMMMEQFQSLRETMESMRGVMEKGFQAVNQRMDGFERRMDSLDQRMDSLEQRMDGLDQRMNGFEQRMDGLDRKIDAVEQRVVERQNEFQSVVLAELQKQTDTLNDKILETDEHLCAVEHQLKVYMESAVGKRVSVLLEGYEFNRDHIAEVKSNEKHLQRQLDELQVRLAVVEKKVSA